MPKKSKKSKHRSRRDSSSSDDSSNRRRDSKRKKQSKSRHRSSSSSPEDSTRNSYELMKRLEARRQQEVVDRKRQREEMKANETPEEKRARRLFEKQTKEQKRRERMGWDKEYQHYTNQDNPFGDSHLTTTFVWSKKLEKEGLKDATTEQLETLNRHKQMENKIELEKVKKRRQERELERQKREEEQNMLQRSREAAQFEEWERQEDQFHLEQARLRSKIRIQDGRAKPIDLLAQYISDQNLDDCLEMQMHEPYTYLNGLGIKDLEDLTADIKVYMELEKSKNSEYWEDLTIIVEDELQKLQKMQNAEYQATLGRREGIHQSVAKDVGEIFRGKTTLQLEELRRKIESKISGQSDGVDVGYWESLLSQLKAHMARSRLRDRHQDNLKHKLQLLRQEQTQISDVVVKKEPRSSPVPSTSQPAEQREESSESEESSQEEDTAEDESIVEESINLYVRGNYSPPYLREEDLEPGTLVILGEDDFEKLEYLRSRMTGREEEDPEVSHEDLRLQKEARKGMNDDEAEFAVETKLDAQIYLWSDKYRPRKPRYFNRVHTGFEWNKYNQTHYDLENPPPKIVQGYKFNIFYPDLIEKNNTPKYFLTPCQDNRDFATLRFQAGPPYEDIAFKIVNRDWEFSYKRGFRCQFHNNIFQLWFHFKRYRYRR
ncbi:splicing factor Cactin [Phlebotomus argentipes]|uniref:splicing factor Cactin n=1 Tax=Phlebotomus argentipes TaxID=94469 RepID=UPI002892DBF1|nr:splicing factor Cactin [Phlebotomus argentipes]